MELTRSLSQTFATPLLETFTCQLGKENYLHTLVLELHLLTLRQRPTNLFMDSLAHGLPHVVARIRTRAKNRNLSFGPNFKRYIYILWIESKS